MAESVHFAQRHSLKTWLSSPGDIEQFGPYNVLKKEALSLSIITSNARKRCTPLWVKAVAMQQKGERLRFTTSLS